MASAFRTVAGAATASRAAEGDEEVVHLGLVLAVGAEALPDERRGVQPQHLDPPVGQPAHDPEEGAEDLGVGVVQVPLELVERRPHPPPGLRHEREAAGREVGEHLAERALVGVRGLAVGERQVEVQVGRVAGQRPLRPLVLAGGVVHTTSTQRLIPRCRSAAASASRSSMVPSAGSTSS